MELDWHHWDLFSSSPLLFVFSPSSSSSRRLPLEASDGSGLDTPLGRERLEAVGVTVVTEYRGRGAGVFFPLDCEETEGEVP